MARPQRLKDIAIGDWKHLSFSEWILVIARLMMVLVLKIAKKIARKVDNVTADVAARLIDKKANVSRSIFVKRWRQDAYHAPDLVHLFPKADWTMNGIQLQSKFEKCF